MRHHNRNSSDATSALAFVILAIIAMPLFGIYLLTRENATDKLIGRILTIVGFIIWFIMAIVSQ